MTSGNLTLQRLTGSVIGHSAATSAALEETLVPVIIGAQYTWPLMAGLSWRDTQIPIMY